MIKKAYSKTFALLMGLALLLAVSPNISAQDSKPFLGTWNGNLSAAGQTLEISATFSLNDDGTIKGTMDIPTQGAQGLNLINITIDGKKISFVIEGAPGDPTFAGELDETGKKIAGEFYQGPATGTFSLEKAGL